MDLWDDIEDDSRNNETDFRNQQLLDNVAQLQEYGKESIDKIKVLMEQLEHEQGLISRKISTSAFSVERDYINSAMYRLKFDKLPLSRQAQEKAYYAVGQLLEFVDSLPEEQMIEERMIAITFREGNYVTDNFPRSGSPKGTGFEGKELEAFNECKESMIVIHNHSYNGRPSGKDLLTYLEKEKIKLSIIACHNGDLYAIYMVRPSFEEKYYELIEKYKVELNTTEMEEVKREAITELYELNENLSDRHKLFLVQQL